MSAQGILQKYVSFFEKREHVRIENSSLVPLNDPSTLFTSSGMQPLVPYLLGEEHPQGQRLVNAQNCLRAQDIDEIGDNRHTTFFRMLGNWSLGEYFKEEQIPWFWNFLTDEEEGVGLDKTKLYVTVFEGNRDIPKDTESIEIWTKVLKDSGLDPQERIFTYGVEKNWWSRSGTPEKMPIGEPGGPDTEVFYEFSNVEHDKKFGESCHVNCDCGRFMEIGNSVFMQFKKTADGFEELPQKNVDFGGGLERLLAAFEGKNDIFETSLFSPIIETITNTTAKEYEKNARQMRIISDHMVSSVFIIANGVKPSNKEQGYVLRRLIRRGLDNFYLLNGDTIVPIIEKIVEQYAQTDEYLRERFEIIKNTILEEEQSYQRALKGGRRLIEKELLKERKRIGDELMGSVEISPETAFKAITSFGLGPTQLESLGYQFDRQKLSEKIKEHQNVSRSGSEKKFAGGLADHSEMTIKGHTATHLLHQALRDVLGDKVHQTGSNITSERVRFDFNFDRRLTEDEIKKVESIVRGKVRDALPVHFEMMKLERAKEIGAIGLFDEKYSDTVKIYFIGDPPYSIEFCGGPHVGNTSEIQSFDILKEEGVSAGTRRIYAKVS